MPLNDSWIAATAIAHRLPVVAQLRLRWRAGNRSPQSV